MTTPLTTTTENLRREARVEARIQVLVVRGRRTIALETSDISFKGLFLRTDEPPALRSLMRLRVVLPLREIEAHAMAVHVAASDAESDGRGPGVGVQFWGLAGPDRIAWDDFVRELIQLKRIAAKKPHESGSGPSGPPTPSGIRVAGSDPPPSPHRASWKK
jgi:hypothetical protein